MNRMLKLLWILFSFFSLISIPKYVSAQACSITFNLPEHKNSDALIGYYYYGNIYVKDSLHFDNSGQAEYQKNALIQQGIYQLFINDNKYIDFLVANDQHFEITLLNGETNPKITASVESENFQRYVNFTKEQINHQKELTEKRERFKAIADSVQKIDEKLSQISTDVLNFQITENAKYPDSFYAKILLANYEPEVDKNKIPPFYLQNDSLKKGFEYDYRKNHYWDYFDLGDLRMWYTPYIQTRLSKYLDEVLIQKPDSVIPAVIGLIEQYRENKPIFQNLTSFILNNSIQSNIMGIENVFVALANKYYLSGEAFWANEQLLKQIKQDVELRENNLIGMTAKELLLEDTAGNYHSLLQQSSKYTILVFWEPECGHCQTEIPRLYNEVFLQNNLSAFAVCTMNNKLEWQTFIQEHELEDWINVWDPYQTSNYNYLYGVQSTPSIFLLDEDKKIIAKNMNVDNLKKIMESLELN